MNVRKPFLMTTVAIAVVALVSACSTSMKRPVGADQARAALTELQATPELASRATTAIKDAELAVQAAEVPQRDKQLAQHLVLIAERKVEMARTLAQTALLEDQRQRLAEQRDTVRLAARTREADLAHAQTEAARTAADRAREATAQARSETLIARTEAQRQQSLAEASAAATEQAQQQSDRMRSEVAELNAKQTERGLVVTLGDVLFASGQSTINTNSAGNLDKVAGFLTRYQDRMVTVEGHTDSTGTEASNLMLSSRRADAVQRYLVEHGVNKERITAKGYGEMMPVSDNTTATGRQQNRRVVLIIANEVASR
ncbi:MAG TPA: OmpA family protein [Permianibacter sp.]|nr:OmpA family protein [Permianibacter sp.]